MAKKLSNRLPKICFTQNDFKAADRMGRFYMRLIQPIDFQLNDRDERYFQKLKWIYPMISDGRPRQHIAAMLNELDGGIWESQVEGLIKDTERLFANFNKANRTLLRGVHREKMLSLAQLIQDNYLTKERFELEDKDGNKYTKMAFPNDSETVIAATEMVRKLWSDVAKYENLDKPDLEEDDARQLPEVSFDDSNLDIELADYDEIPENTVYG